MNRIRMGVLLTALLWNAGCSDPPAPAAEPTEPPIEAGAVAEPLIRMINVHPERMDLLAGSDPFIADVAFGTSTDYRPLPEGMALSLRVTGVVETLASGHTRELLPERRYTVVSLPKELSSTGLWILSDEFTSLEPDMGRVRLINATRDREQMDLSRAGSATRILRAIGPEAGVDMAYANMRSGPVEVRSSSRAGTPLIAKLNVEAGKLSTFVVVGSGGSWDVVQVVDSAAP